MNNLKKFCNNFLELGFDCDVKFADEHTLRISFRSSFINQCVLNYVNKSCPYSCHYFIAVCPVTDVLYICVYDD